jgi:site-specific recombinase XerD
LLATGCDIKTVSARLGHSSTETTNIYLHMLESVDKQAAQQFDDFVIR